MLEEGVFNAIVVQKPFNMGYLGVGKYSAFFFGARSFRKWWIPGSELITKENMYTDENQKIPLSVLGLRDKRLCESRAFLCKFIMPGVKNSMKK